MNEGVHNKVKKMNNLNDEDDDNVEQLMEDEELKSLMFEDESSFEEGADAKRISSSSRVNFSKLTKKEQA